MVAKIAAKAPSSKAKAKSSPKASSKVAEKPLKSARGPAAASPEGVARNHLVGWLQDASLEVPTPASVAYAPGSRELEFSVGMRQQEVAGATRSELRGRAMVHADGAVLVLVEASFVVLTPQSDAARPDLPQQLYAELRPRLESLLALAGHTPPLPASLEQVG